MTSFAGLSLPTSGAAKTLRAMGEYTLLTKQTRLITIGKTPTLNEVAKCSAYIHAGFRGSEVALKPGEA